MATGSVLRRHCWSGYGATGGRTMAKAEIRRCQRVRGGPEGFGAAPEQRLGRERMVGPVGLEPTTYGLKVRSSAIELETRQRPTPAGPKHQPA